MKTEDKINRESQAFVVTVGEDYIPGEPYTGDFQIIESSIMEQYAIKNSKQIDEDKEDWADFRQPKYDLEDLAKILEYNVWHKKAVDAVSNDAMGRGWTLQKRPDLGHEPNEQQKEQAKQFIRELSIDINKIFHDTIYDRRSMAVAAIEILRLDKSQSPPYDLKNMSVQYLHPHKDKVRVKQVVGTKSRWFIIYGKNRDEAGNKYDVHCETGKKHPYNSLPAEERANEIIWFNEYAPQDKVYGLANIVPALNAVYGDLGRVKYNLSFFKNRGIPALLITITGDFEDYNIPEYIYDEELRTTIKNPEYDPKKTLKSQVREMTKQVMKNPQSTMVITAPSQDSQSNVEIKAEKLDTDVNDASFRLYRRDNREEVSVADGVPLERMGVAVTGQLGGNIAEEMGDTYADTTIPLIMKENDDWINQLLLNEFGITDWIFKTDTFRKKDAKKELDMGTLILEHGGLTIGEYATYFGKQFGAEIPDIPLMSYRIVCGQLVDDMGQPVQAMAGVDADGLLSGLEQDLISEAEQIEDNYTTGVSTKNTGSIDGSQDTPSTEMATNFAETIKRTFGTRK